MPAGVAINLRGFINQELTLKPSVPGTKRPAFGRSCSRTWRSLLPMALKLNFEYASDLGHLDAEDSRMKTAFMNPSSDS